MKYFSRHNAILITILIVAYFCLLFWIYGNDISTRWAYKGFVNKLGLTKICLSLVGIVLTVFFYIKVDKKYPLISSLIMNLFNLLFFIPMYVLCAYQPMLTGFYIFLLLYQVIFFTIYLFSNFKFRPLFPKSNRIFYSILGFILFSTFVINAYYNGFKIKIDLSDVYENRLAARDLQIPTILSYIKAFSYSVGIIALMYAFKTKKKLLIVSIVLLQLMSFAFGASKTQFFTIFLCFIGYYFYTDKLRYWAPLSLIILLVLSILENQYLSSTSISDIWTRRTLFVPSKISYNMYDFLATPGREYLYLRGSIMRIFGFEDPYIADNGFQRLIGLLYDGGNEDTNANTGLLGNDYAQFGWLSLLIFPLLRVYFLKLLDYCAQGIDNRICVILSIVVSFAYISGAFFTALITKAILLVCYLLYCYPNSKEAINTYGRRIRRVLIK